MLDIKQAVARAKEHAIEVFGDDKIADLLLEEVDYADGPPTWKVTVSFIRPEQSQGSLASFRLLRTFKVVHLDALTGDLQRVTHRAGGIAA